jgi:Protein of unknown function (DUF2281)
MLTAIKGIYKDGTVILNEKPPIDTPMEVIVTFTQEIETPTKKQRKAGFAKGFFTYVAPDFNEPLDDLKEYMYWTFSLTPTL